MRNIVCLLIIRVILLICLSHGYPDIHAETEQNRPNTKYQIDEAMRPNKHYPHFAFDN